MQQLNSLFRSNTKTPKPQGRRRSQDPVLTAEDEAFLRDVTSESSVGGQETVVSGAGQPSASAEAPTSQVEEFGKELGEEERRTRAAAETSKDAGVDVEFSTKAGDSAQEKKKRPWSSLWKKGEKKSPERQKPEIAPAPATSDSPAVAKDKDDNETKRENEDMTEILDQLNLAADNNRVFSISVETQELLRKFKLILKDLINGVPTAYHDLEMLLTNGNKQLQDTYTKLPSFLQKLIEKLPERWTEALAPEMLAVAAERASRSGVNVENIGKAAAAANKMGLNVPSLKEMVGKPAAIVGLLRSIMAFLRARFPAVLGMNVLWSLALFILLFVLWYCHKRGREVRLEGERLVTEEEIEKLNQDSSDGTAPQIRSTETLRTTAAQGASTAEIREGIKEAQKVRDNTATAPTDEERQDKPSGVENEPIKPTRSKSILSIFGRSSSANSPSSRIAPYPGT